jgi:UDP-N-acetylmuramyl pentapeptide synthase
MAWAAGADIGQIAAGLTKFGPAAQRLQIMELANGLRLLNDSYNANPASMLAALNTARMLGQGEQCIAVLGDMLELGEFSAEAHTRIGEAVSSQGFSYLLALGDYAGTMAAAAIDAGMKKERVKAFAGKEALAACLQELLAAGRITAGDILLLKGSRGMEMEKIIDKLI